MTVIDFLRECASDLYTGASIAVSIIKPLLSDAASIVSVSAAILLKLFYDERMTFSKALATTSSAVVCALIFGPAIVDYLGYSNTRVAPAVYALTALTGEHILRMLLEILKDPKILLPFIKAVRGGK